MTRTLNNKEEFRQLARAEDDGFPIDQIFRKEIITIFENQDSRLKERNVAKEDQMPVQMLRRFLDKNKVKYTVISHSTAYTAQETAQSAHISGNEMVKTIIIKINNITAMIVMLAPQRIDLEQIKELAGTDQVRIASEFEFKNTFPDCEIGAISPFGNLYAIEVYVTKDVTECKDIIFNAGNHRELIKMKYKDFERLVHPGVIDFPVAVSR